MYTNTLYILSIYCIKSIILNCIFCNIYEHKLYEDYGAMDEEGQMKPYCRFLMQSSKILIQKGFLLRMNIIICRETVNITRRGVPENLREKLKRNAKIFSTEQKEGRKGDTRLKGNV